MAPLCAEASGKMESPQYTVKNTFICTLGGHEDYSPAPSRRPRASTTDEQPARPNSGDWPCFPQEGVRAASNASTRTSPKGGQHLATEATQISSSDSWPSRTMSYADSTPLESDGWWPQTRPMTLEEAHPILPPVFIPSTPAEPPCGWPLMTMESLPEIESEPNKPSLLDSALSLSLKPEGRKLVQRAVEVGGRHAAIDASMAIQGNVLKAARCPHAHHVLLQLLHELGQEVAEPFAQELVGEGRNLSMEPFASLVLVALVRRGQCSQGTAVRSLIEEILAHDLASLCYHKHAHKVAVAIIAHGAPHQREQVYHVLCSEAQRACRHRVAASTVVGALLQASHEHASGLARAIMETPGAVKTLACHCFGVRVVRAMLQVPGDVSQQAFTYLEKSKSRLQRDKFGLELLKDLESHRITHQSVGGA
mmetsp:Transcript_20782/g.44373  ORF Transcript_20782/g.44373 Transcript_20782/m.44373 type:complete len:423 (-) Transcript_20782:106-1374(-)